jgi:hypothetical protein
MHSNGIMGSAERRGAQHSAPPGQGAPHQLRRPREPRRDRRVMDVQPGPVTATVRTSMSDARRTPGCAPDCERCRHQRPTRPRLPDVRADHDRPDAPSSYPVTGSSSIVAVRRSAGRSPIRSALPGEAGLAEAVPVASQADHVGDTAGLPGAAARRRRSSRGAAPRHPPEA